MDRHETLRTTFQGGDEGPVQAISETLKVVIEVEDSSASKDHELSVIAKKEAMDPFNLSTGPLFRAKLFRISEKNHLMVFTMHHIVSDGWSLNILFNELVLGYFSMVEDREPELPELRIQYRDFAAWQDRLLEQDLLNDQKNYWADNLKGELPVLDLPTDRPRPLIQTTNGTIYQFEIDKQLTDSLRNVAKQQEVTLFMLLLGSLDLLLHRMCNQDDIIVGSPIAGRNHSDLEGLVGFFVNTIALRTDMSGDPDFTEVLDRVKRTCLGAYANQDYPFDKVIEMLNVTRDTSRTPVFNIMLSMQDISEITDLPSVEDFSLRPIGCEPGSAKFDMTLFAFDTGTHLEMRIEYNTDLFDEETVVRFAGLFSHLLSEIVEKSADPVSAYDILGDQERQKVLDGFNATFLDYPRERSLIDLFEARVLESGPRGAVAFKDEVLSFDQLNARSNRLGNFLKSFGVTSGTVVGMMAGSPIESIVAILGIMKAGGAYMPIDPDFPEGRIEFMLRDSGTGIVVTKEAFFDRLPNDIKGICFERDHEKIDTCSSENPDHGVTADDPAYIIYTSGSTGKPKGTVIPQRGVVNLVYALEKEVYSFYEGPLNVALVASYSFDASVQQIFASLLLGHTLYPIPGDMKKELDVLIPYLLNHKIQVIDGTPSLWELMVENDIAETPSLALKHVVIGGEALPASLIERFAEGACGKSVRWTNVYGVTESSVDSTSFLADPDSLRGRSYAPIGSPLANTQIYILDKYMKPLPVGVSGEMYIGGDGLAKEYLNNPERTKENFIPDPFIEGGRIYRTGDLGRWLPDGNIEFFGRIDSQVKIRGFRIELGEIESELSNHQEVSDCVVVDRKDDAGASYLLAYYVSGEEIPVNELRSFLGRFLPEYMIPSRYMQLDALPLNTSGKVDRRALPDMDGIRPELASAYVAPRDDLEEVITRVWMEVLGLDKVGVFDNFFDLGGDSIISLQVVSRLKKKSYVIRPRDMFEHQTIADIVHVVETDRRVEAEQGTVTGDAPLTPIQRYFFSMGLANENHFNQSLMFKSLVRIDENALRNSLQALLDHHDVLRSRFGEEVQTHKPLGEKALLIVKDLAADNQLPDEVRDLQTLFNINKGPVFGAGLFHADECDYLVFSGHHLVLDGVSWRILLEDLFMGYGAVLNGQDIVLPEKTTSYKYWATCLEAYAEQPEVKEEIAFWKNEFPAEIAIPATDYDQGGNTMASADVIRISLDEEQTGHFLKDVHKAYNTDANDILLTALLNTLTQWTQKESVVFDLEGHGREDIFEEVDISRTVGWFTSVYPVMLAPDSKDDIAERIKYVKERLRKIPLKGFNYGLLKYMHRQPLPINTGISFNYLGQTDLPGADGSFKMIRPDLTITMDGLNTRANLVDIVCMVEASRLTVDIVYSRNKHKKQTIRAIAKKFKEELLCVIDHCLDPKSFDCTPSDFDLVDLDQDVLDKLLDFE